MKRIVFLSIFFAALIEFALERAGFDLWIVVLLAIVTLLLNVLRLLLRPHVDAQKHQHNASAAKG
jgi:hypothetical protein